MLISLELQVPDIEPDAINRVVGFDVGQRYHAVTTDTTNKTHFYSWKQCNHRAIRYQKARKYLQQKGTGSAKRCLVSLSGRERRFVADKNHCLSKQIATPNTLIGLENLTNIRERTKPRKTGDRASVKQRKANYKQAKWSFAQLRSFLDYKAILNNSGSSVLGLLLWNWKKP